MKPRYFKSGEEMRRWLTANHENAAELWVGFYKKSADNKGVSWSEAVDQALCFGWIDGVRKGIDDHRFTIRFTRRKPGSIWSAVNIAKAEDLSSKGLMEPAGLAAFERRDDKRSKVYSYEQKQTSFDTEQEKHFRAEKEAWDFFNEQAPSYRRTATWWVISAKRPETRDRRLEKLIAASARRERLSW
ncbi:MAG: YdeI/OmpD-associated family protein [Actinomycetota bacterium]|nr:YdeI/OmpD-associated family protein [Actinomycetota bacterium]